MNKDLTSGREVASLGDMQELHGVLARQLLKMVTAGQVVTKVIVKAPDGTLVTTQDVNVLLETLAGGSLGLGIDIIKGITDASGEIQDTRSFATNQPVAGWVRKGTSPYYRESAIAGTIDTANGLVINVQMISDE